MMGRWKIAVCTFVVLASFCLLQASSTSSHRRRQAQQHHLVARNSLLRQQQQLPAGSQPRASEVPAARPELSKRLFTSQTVEDTIKRVGEVIKDDTIRQIFENCLPSTLDTTVYLHRKSNASNPIAYTYIVTGDIPAMWLRDSTYQVNPYVPMAKDDGDLRELVLGVINTQADMINLYPFGNAYYPLKSWDSDLTLEPPGASQKDIVQPPYKVDEVFEAKYELDSLASFLYLSKFYYEETGDSAFLSNPAWRNATELILNTLRDQQGGTIAVMNNPPFKFSRPTTTASETTNLYGVGNPVKKCGLIRSFFRPSDDSTIFQYLIPSNAMAVVGLEGVANLLDAEKAFPELSTQLRTLAGEVKAAIEKYAIVEHPEFGKVYAFEVDCYGSHVFMDDANFPSLLSLPKFGFVQQNDSVYLNTRKYVLSPEWNPYYADGKFPGVGSPHTGLQKPWHMALAMQAMTTSNQTEILSMLALLRNSTAKTGFMHESFNVNDPNDFTRTWFAWANTVFGDLILHLYKNFPHLLAGEPARL